MARLRARMAKSVVDKDLHSQLAIALRALTETIKICDVAAKKGSPSVSRAKVEETRHRLLQALRLLSGIGYLTPSFDLADPDLNRNRNNENTEQRVK